MTKAGNEHCYVHVLRTEDAIYVRCSATGRMAKMEEDLLENCPICKRPIVVQTDELNPHERIVHQVCSTYLDRWLTVDSKNQEAKLPEFKKYARKGFSEMRPYVPGEDLSNISVAEVDIPEEGGMVARNPKNHEDQWYVARQYFEDNLELAGC